MLLTEIARSITLRTGKMSKAQVEQLAGDAVSLLSLLQSPFLPKSHDMMQRWMEILMRGELDLTKWPPPLVHMKNYEANPGVWIFDDSTTGITFFVFSDEHRKNAFKGTSVDVIRPHNLEVNPGDDLAGPFIDRAIAGAISRLFDKMLELSR